MDRGGQSGSHYFVLPRGSGRRVGVGVGAGVRKGKNELVSVLPRQRQAGWGLGAGVGKGKNELGSDTNSFLAGGQGR